MTRNLMFNGSIYNDKYLQILHFYLVQLISDIIIAKCNICELLFKIFHILSKEYGCQYFHSSMPTVIYLTNFITSESQMIHPPWWQDIDIIISNQLWYQSVHNEKNKRNRDWVKKKLKWPLAIITYRSQFVYLPLQIESYLFSGCFILSHNWW